MTTVELPRPLVNQLLFQAQSHPEQEVCGLLAQRDGIPCRYYPVANAAGNNARRFEMEPQQQIAAMRTMRERGEQLFAIFHSHPDAPATPSVEDLRHDEYPEALRLIASLNTKGVLELQAYRVEQDRLEAVDLELSEE